MALFDRWNMSVNRKPKRRPISAQIAVQTLDERIVPSHSFYQYTAPGPATHFELLAPSQATSGSTRAVELVALDANNRIASGYTGTVQLTSSDSGDTLPTSYTFTASDRGVHLFKVGFSATGSDTLTAADTATASIDGTATVTVNAAPVATHFFVVSGRRDYAGTAENVTVYALDANNRIVSNYTGTVALTSTDTGATLPASYTFTAADKGVHTFSITDPTAGSYTVTATDSATPSITGSVSVTVAAAPVVTQFYVATGPSDYAGVAASVTVFALDASGHIVRGYTGTVQLTSTDTGSTLPASYTFTAADNGVHTFSITDAASGTYTVTATDTATSTITGSTSVTVTAAPVATQLAVVKVYGTPGSSTAEYAVVALDSNGRIVPNYTGTVTFTSSDTGATLPADYTFTAADAGVHFFSVTYSSTASKSSEDLTATDTATASITGVAKSSRGHGYWI